MLIKIGNQVFDSKDQPIVIVLQDGDLQNMYRVEGNMYRLCLSSNKMSEEDVKELMRLEVDPDHCA